jgi:imidazoleglycerol phosphate dehydratase HisB
MLANEATAIGELLRRTAAKDKSSIERYCGFVYNLVGNDAAAIPCLESAARDITDAEGREVVVMLVDSYVRTGQKDRARSYLQSLARTSGMAPLANQLLAHLDVSPP